MMHSLQPEAIVRPLKISAILALAATLCTAQPARKEVIGYFPGYKWKPVSGVMTVATVPFNKLTMINYAFWCPKADGSLAPWDSAGDAVYLQGPAESR